MNDNDKEIAELLRKCEEEERSELWRKKRDIYLRGLVLVFLYLILKQGIYNSLKVYDFAVPLLLINIAMTDAPFYRNRRLLYFIVNLVLVVLTVAFNSVEISF